MVICKRKSLCNQLNYYYIICAFVSHYFCLPVVLKFLYKSGLFAMECLLHTVTHRTIKIFDYDSDALLTWF